MNVNEWTGTEYPAEIVEQAVSWLGYLDSFVDTKSLKGEDSTSEILEQSVHKLNYSKRLEFYEWLGSDPTHQYIFADCCEMWAKTSCLNSLKSSLNKSNVLFLPVRNQKTTVFHNSYLMGESYTTAQHAPVWAYNLVIGLILVGLSLPSISNLL